MMEPMDFGVTRRAQGLSNEHVPLEKDGSRENLLQNEVYLRQLPEMICGTVQRHCTPYPTTLRIRKRFFTRKVHSEVFTLDNNECLYKCLSAPEGLRDRRTLVELATGLPALNFKNRKFRLSNRFSVRLGDSYNQIGRVAVQQVMGNTKLYFDFVDSLSCDKRRICFKARQWSKSFTLSLGDPKEGGLPIAHMYLPYPPTSRSRFTEYINEYKVDIAPGVDVALVMGLILIADDYITIFT